MVLTIKYTQLLCQELKKDSIDRYTDVIQLLSSWNAPEVYLIIVILVAILQHLLRFLNKITSNRMVFISAFFYISI